MRRPRLLVLASMSAILLGLVSAATIPALAGTASTAPTTGFRFVDITTHDGVLLKANVNEPTTPGKHPAIVFVNSWGLNDLEYLAQADTLAAAGYTVLSYTTRGFWTSGGQIDTAGPLDVRDSRTVIDWMLANTTADPSRIGSAGISYGAGISLISSAFDSRIKAVAAMSGWTDLVESLYGSNTRRPQAVALLQVAATLLGRPSAELSEMLDDYWANRDIESIKAFARVRSALTYVNSINANHPAILMANSYGDSLFPPNQLVDFFGALTGPKRLELAPGDHAVVEATGLVGLDNHVWTSVRRWFDQYLAGVNTGIASEPPVVLRPKTGGSAESYVDWADVASSIQRLGLGEVRWWDGTGPLGGAPTTGWSRTALAIGDTTASAGVALLTNAWEALTGDSPSVWTPSIDRARAGVWKSDGLGTTAIRGIARLHLTVKPSQSNGTVVGYLYDVDSWGNADLITHAPATWLGATPNAALGVDVVFPATAYTVPSGHRLAVVVDTEDGLYLDANPWGASITFTGQSWLDLPLR
jgi:dienelactone hydrolase